MPNSTQDGSKPRRVSFDASIEMDEGGSYVAAKLNEVAAKLNEVEKVNCECCGMMEDCTPTYIGKIRGFYGGKWVCGLCSEAVEEKKRKYGLSSIEAALERHMALCKQFNMNIRRNPELSLAGAMRDFARNRSLHRGGESKKSSSCSTNCIRRSISCIPQLGVNNGAA